MIDSGSVPDESSSEQSDYFEGDAVRQPYGNIDTKSVYYRALLQRTFTGEEDQG